ncbi:hypothetical protein [Nostoc sp.]|uniref:hypothetical protein n=1 Tax=Nostoc sp. TaxID=1180 RepID=UPI002FF47A27
MGYGALLYLPHLPSSSPLSTPQLRDLDETVILKTVVVANAEIDGHPALWFHQPECLLRLNNTPLFSLGKFTEVQISCLIVHEKL